MRPSRRARAASSSSSLSESVRARPSATARYSEGRIVGREELYTTVWGGPMRSDERSVDVYVHKLRSKLAEVLPEWRFIHTHVGFGYRFGPERSHAFHKG